MSKNISFNVNIHCWSDFQEQYIENCMIAFLEAMKIQFESTHKENELLWSETQY